MEFKGDKVEKKVHLSKNNRFIQKVTNLLTGPRITLMINMLIFELFKYIDLNKFVINCLNKDFINLLFIALL